MPWGKNGWGGAWGGSIVADAPVATADPTYHYVASTGNDEAAGTFAAPWASLAAVAAHTLNPGDTVFLNKGDTFSPEAGFVLGQSGTAGNTINFAAYGTGARPIIVGPAGASGFDLSNRSYVTISGIDVQASATSPAGFDMSPASHITFTSCEASGSLYGPFWAYGAPANTHDITISSCIAHDGVSFGITADSTGIGTSGPTGIVIENCTSYDNGTDTAAHHGIYCKYTPNVIIRGNTCYGNASSGIKVNSEDTANSATGALVYNNYCHDNLYGITIAAESGTYYNNLITNSTTVDLYGVGIYWINSPRSVNNTVVHNTIINSQLAGLAFYQDATHTGNTIKNNIIMQDNAVVGDKKCIFVANDGTAIGAGNTWDYNLYFSDGVADNHIVQNSGADMALAAWQAKAGEANSANADPVFTTEFSNMHLQVTSAAIAHGDPAVGILLDKDGVTRGVAADAGCYEYVAA